MEGSGGGLAWRIVEGSGGGLAWRDSGRFRRRVSLEG